MIYPQQASSGTIGSGCKAQVKYGVRFPKIGWGLLCTAVLIVRDPATPTLPLHLGSYTRALLVS